MSAPLEESFQETSLMGTSFCKDTTCIECMCRLRCSWILLNKNLELIAKLLHAPLEELFPARAFHKLVVEGE